MYRRALFSIFLILVFSGIAFSQVVAPDEVQLLQKQILPLLEKKKLDEVIPLAEKIVKIEKAGGEKNLANYTVAIHNLAQWKNQRIKGPRKGTIAPYDKYREEIKETEALFRELLVIANRTDDKLLLSMTQADLAYFLARHFGKWSEIEGLLVQSLAYKDREGPSESESAITLIDNFSRMCWGMGELEKFIPLNRRLVKTIEKKYGDKSERLVAPLGYMASALFVTGEAEQAAAIEQRISQISPNQIFKSEPMREIVGRAESEIDRSFGRAGARTSGDLSSIGSSVDSRVYSGVPGTVTGPGLPSSREISYATAHAFSVDFVVDERGNVGSAAIDPEVIVATKVKEMVIKRVLTWKFRPFVFEGRPGKMRGRVKVYYYE